MIAKGPDRDALKRDGGPTLGGHCFRYADLIVVEFKFDEQGSLVDKLALTTTASEERGAGDAKTSENQPAPTDEDSSGETSTSTDEDTDTPTDPSGKNSATSYSVHCVLYVTVLLVGVLPGFALHH